MSIQTYTIEMQGNVFTLPDPVWQKFAAPRFTLVTIGDTLVLKPQDGDEEDWPLDEETRASLEMSMKEDSQGQVSTLQSFKSLRQ